MRPGQLVDGRFQIEAEVATGGMGRLLRALDVHTGRPVALKVIATHDPSADERFRRESTVLAKVRHPALVEHVAHGRSAAGEAYLAMEWLDGKDLREHFGRRSDLTLPARGGFAPLLSVTDALTLTRRVASALAELHRNGVVHRDVKPANMVLTMDEYEVKVTDFGVAHLMDASKTRTGTIMGSPSFMSPEHVSGRRVDGRSDLWSLGVSLYQLLTGHLPFTGEPLATLMYRIANEPPDNLRDWRPDIPANVNAVIAKALAKDPDARYQTGRGMAGALRQCLAKLGAAAGN